MNQSFKLVMKDSLRYLWIAVLAAVVVAAFYALPKIMPLRENHSENAGTEGVVQEKEAYRGNWESYPEAHQFVICSLEIQPDLMSAEERSDPAASLKSYGRLAQQYFLSFGQMQTIYSSLVRQFDGLFPRFSRDDMESEMISVYLADSFTLFMSVDAPLSLRDADNPSFSDEDLCGMRDHVFSLLAQSVEESDYLSSLPVRLNRISRETEKSLSEMDLIREMFTEDMDEQDSQGLSLKKTLLFAFFGFALAFFHCIVYCYWKRQDLARTGSKTDGRSDQTA